MTRQVHSNIPVGVMDTDSDLTQVAAQDFTDSYNTRQYPGSKSRRKILGNRLTVYSQPAGVNTVLGSCEDEVCKSLIEFVKNSNNDHQIRRLFDDGTYELLKESSVFNFNNRITESAIVDGRHLFWTDARGDKTVTGNPPRYLDLDYLSLSQKQLCYELYWDEASFGVGNNYAIEIVDLDGAVILASTIFRTSAGGAVDVEAELLFNALDAGGFDIEVTFCGNKIAVKANIAEQRVIITSTGSDIHFTPVNHYPETMLEEYINLIRVMPRVAPQPRFVQDGSIVENKVYGFTFQFIYRYLFWNGAKSKWSPVSYVPTNFITGAEIETSEDYNKIEIDFVDDVFGNADSKAFVRKVEIAVRYEFSGNFRSIGVFDIADFGVASSVGFEFLNDGSYPVVPSDENSEADVQALGNFDFIPKLSRGLEVIQDEDGDHRLTLGGNIEQYDTIDCADADIVPSLQFPINAPATAATDQTKTRMLFKRGGLYDVFVRYEDDYGRQWADIPIGRYSAPWDADNIPEITINHLPPIDATRFRLAFSLNQNQAAYIQLPAFKVDYWIVDQDDGTYTSTTYAAGDADLVGFQFIINDIDTPVNYSFKNDDKLFQVQPGDRLHINFTNEDYLVEGYSPTDPAGVATIPRYTVFIKFEAGMTDYTLAGGPTDHHVVELYRPQNGDSGLAYEIGDPISIVDAGLSTRNHGPTIQITDLGDTYNYKRNFINLLTGTTPTVAVSTLERAQLYGFKTEVGPDFGRASTIDPDYSEIDSYNQVRASGIFIPNTQTNGFHSFRGLEYIKTRRNYGPIQSLQYVGNLLVVVNQTGLQPIYIGKGRVMDLSGNTSVGRSNQLFNIANELANRYGTHNPESIVNTGRYLYGWDGYEGLPWRYSVGGGVDAINYKNINLFRNLGKSTFPRRDDVVGGYEPQFETYYMTFVGTGTYGFVEGNVEEGRLGLEGRFLFQPECYGRLGQRFFSYTSGANYEHEIDTQTIYGSAFNADLKVVVNSVPRAVKVFWQSGLQGDLWYFHEIIIPPGITPDGMLSRAIASKFTKHEGVWNIDLPRDGTDPLVNPPPSDPTLFVHSLLRGRHLRGEVMELLLRLNGSNGVIKRIDTEFTFSEETKK